MANFILQKFNNEISIWILNLAGSLKRNLL